MTAVIPKPLSGYPWFIRLFFWKQERTYGKVLEPGAVGTQPMGLRHRRPSLRCHEPQVLAAGARDGAMNRRSSPLAPALRSLVTIRVSQINHCAYCVDNNSATLLKRGGPTEKVEALAGWRDSELYTDDERSPSNPLKP